MEKELVAENLISNEGTYKIFRDNKGTEYVIVGQSDDEYFGFRIGDDQRSHGKKDYFTDTGKILYLSEVNEILYRCERSWLALCGGSPKDKVDEYGVVVDFGSANCDHYEDFKSNKFE